MRIDGSTYTYPSPAPARAAQSGPSEAVFRAVDQAFNLDDSFRIGTLAELSDGEQADFLTLTARLLREGVIGRETKEVDGRPYTSFADTAIYQPDWLRGAPDYRGGRLDVVA